MTVLGKSERAFGSRQGREANEKREKKRKESNSSAARFPPHWRCKFKTKKKKRNEKQRRRELTKLNETKDSLGNIKLSE